MMSAPTIATSSSGSLFTSPGCQLGMEGLTLRLCSGAAYLSANVGVDNSADSAASAATATRDFFMAPPCGDKAEPFLNVLSCGITAHSRGVSALPTWLDQTGRCSSALSSLGLCAASSNR